MRTTGCRPVSDDNSTRVVLSNFMREKPGASSPGCSLPARARVQKLSKGTMRNVGPGILAITRPNVSGGWFMAHQMNPRKTAYKTPKARRPRTNHVFLDVMEKSPTKWLRY